MPLFHPVRAARIERQVISLDQFYRLSHLIWLRFSMHVLKINHLLNIRVLENVVAPVHPFQAKAEGFYQTYEVIEPDVLRPHQNFLEQSLLIHLCLSLAPPLRP